MDTDAASAGVKSWISKRIAAAQGDVGELANVGDGAGAAGIDIVAERVDQIAAHVVRLVVGNVTRPEIVVEVAGMSFGTHEVNLVRSVRSIFDVAGGITAGAALG